MQQNGRHFAYVYGVIQITEILICMDVSGLQRNQIIPKLRLCRCRGQAKWRDGKLLPKWSNMVGSARVDSLCAAAKAMGFKPAGRRTVHSLHLLDRANVKRHKLSFIEDEDG